MTTSASSDPQSATPASTPPVRVWDVPTRLFHWALVAAILFQFATAELEVFGYMSMDYHALGGQTVLTLLVFRLLWGLLGSDTSRFAQFVRGPFAALGHLTALIGNRPEAPHVGHNPAGGLMVVVLLAVLLVIAVTGLFSSDDIMFEGPLAATVSGATGSLMTEIHEGAFNLLFLLVILHVVAVAFYTLIKRQPLVAAMITGRRRDMRVETAPGVRFASPWLALLLLGISIVLVWGGVALYGN